MNKKLLGALIGSLFYSPLFATEASASKEDSKPKFAAKEYDLDTGLVVITFGNGKTVDLDTNSLSAEIQKQLMLHGASQKMGDSYAGAKGDYAKAIESAADVVEQLKAGVWRASRDDDARPRLAELAEAIARIKQVDLTKATAAVEAANDEQRKGWRSNPKVKAVIAQLRAEKAAAALQEAEKQGAKELEVNFG